MCIKLQVNFITPDVAHIKVSAPNHQRNTIRENLHFEIDS